MHFSLTKVLLKVIIDTASKNKNSVKGARIGKTEIDMSQR